MAKQRNYNRSGNGFLARLLGYAITSLIIPFVIYIVKRKLVEQQRLVCNKCHGKLELVERNQYYCRNCKTIRIDHDK